jgi:hypothetical protein
MSDDIDDRQPTDFAAKALPLWEGMSAQDRIGCCVRIRTDAFLEYPQTDPVAFAKLRELCRGIENPVPWFPKPEDEPAPSLTLWQRIVFPFRWAAIVIWAALRGEKIE